MSLASTAIVGAIWSVTTRLGARFVGLVGTLVITRFLSPEVMGEVGVAVVAVLTAQFISDFAFGQYIVVKSKDDPGAVFHAFFYNLLTLALAAITLLALAAPIGDFLGAEEMTRYLPVMVLSLVFERLARIPESVALRDLRFKLFASATAASELTYVGVSLSMAAAGFGGDSIVWANVAQYGLRLVWMGLAVHHREWFHPVKITWRQTRGMLGFGVPLAIGNAAHFASHTWDRLVVTGLFGAHVHGLYGLGKSLAAVPADNIGDAVADVLMPSFVRMTPEEARIAVVRASHYIAIIVYPLAAGLAVVSPTLVQALFTPEWYDIAMPLTVLAAVSLIDPMGDTMSSYLKARHMPWAVMFIQISFLGVILAATFALGYYFGLMGACFGVGVGMFYRAMCALLVANRLDHVPVIDMMAGLIRVALASGVMALAVLGIRELVTGQLDSILLALGIEIAVGGIAFVPAAFLLAGPIARDVVTWVRKRRAGEHLEDESSDENEDEDGSNAAPL